MKLTIALAASAAALLASNAANATVMGTTGNNGSAFVALSQAGLGGGAVATLTGGTIYTNTQNVATLPMDPIFGGTFLATGPNSGPLATFDFTAGVNYLSFLWGSPDAYNQVQITTSLGTVKNFTALGMGFPATGAPDFSQYVQFSTSQGEYITKATFTNNPSKDAFEVGNFRVAAVPEPATWAMMIAGFGLVGTMLRRRHKQSLAVSFG